jgi:hypothetical protein
MKKLFFAALALLTLSPAWAQAGLQVAAQPSKGVKPIPARENAQSLNPVLREVAQALAVALGDAPTRRAVKAEVGKKFDGDFDVLYRELANSKIGNGKTFRQALGGAVGMVQKRAGKATGSEDAVKALDEYASALPQLQISVPVGFKDWNASKVAPLVAFVPNDVDDSELREVEAFDATGRRYLLDSQVEPMFPVVVVGLNERTDRNGYLRREFAQASPGNAPEAKLMDPNDPTDPGTDVPYENVSPSYPSALSGTCDARTHAYGDHEFLHEIKINNDHEPWIKGSPEIYATYSFVDSQNYRGQFFLSNVDNEGQWYSINGPLFYWQSYYGNTFVMAVWEQDGSDYGTFTYNYQGFNYTVAVHDGDDQLGSALVSFLDPNCGYYSTGDAEFKLRYEGASTAGGCGEASCVPVQGMYVSHFSGPGCTGTESYYLPYDGYGYSCRTWNGTGQCGTIHRTVTNYSARINGGPCQDLWPSGNTLSDFVTIYR